MITAFSPGSRLLLPRLPSGGPFPIPTCCVAGPPEESAARPTSVVIV